jgi:hypothetical protein
MMLLRLLFVLVAIVSAAAPVLASDEQDCFQGQEPELGRINGCSEVHPASSRRATAYHNRAVAYGLGGDIDNAIADYTRLSRFHPTI